MKKLTKKQIGEKYDSFSKWYNLAEILNILITRAYRKKLLKNAQGNILEVGIGTGANLRYYPLESVLTAVDYSTLMLAQARKNAKKLGIDVQLRTADAEKLPFKKEQFDTIVDTLCICTYPNPVKALKEMKRVCKKGGQILLLEHGRSSNSFIRKMQQKRAANHYNSIGCHLLRDPYQLAKAAGLKIVRYERKLFGIIYLISAKPS